MFNGSGPLKTYGANAAVAASAGGKCSQGGCPSCVKTGLPMLLVRPGVVAKPYMSHIQGHFAPLLRTIGLPRLKYLDYAARTLREGYLYAFYEKPHTAEIKAQSGWQVNLVDEGGYLTPVPLSPIPLVGVGEVPKFSCERTAGYAAAMLFVIPDAKNTGRVWVAFSESPWAPKVLERYAKDEALRNRRMTCIDAPKALAGASLPLTAASVEKLVYDYAPNIYSFAGVGNPYQRWLPRMVGALEVESKIPQQEEVPVRSEGAYDVLSAAREVVARGGNQYAESDSLLVMVNDVIGISHETAVLRATYFKTAGEYVLGRADGNVDKADWMLKSALSIEGLIASLTQAGQRKQQEYDEAGYTQYHKTSMMYDEFNRLQQTKQLPPEADFMEASSISTGAGNPSLPDYSIPGTVLLPSPVKQAEEQCEKLRKKLRGYGTTSDYKTFLGVYEQHAARDAEGILAMEGDHFSCLDCSARKLVYENDFDESDALSGFFYASTTARILCGGHITGNSPSESAEAAPGSLGKGGGGDWYSKYLSDDPSLRENILLRALLGNTSRGFSEWLDKRDGHFGLMSNVVDNVEELARNPAAAGWIRFGGKTANGLRMLASGYVSALLPVVGGVACLLKLSGRLTPVALVRMGNLISLVSSAGARYASATLVGVTMPLYKALRVWRRMMISIQDASVSAGRVTAANRAAVVNFGSMLKTIGATTAADALVEVYMWIDKAPREMEAWAQANALKSVAATGVTRHAMRAAHYAIRLMPGVASATWTQATRHITGNTLAQLTGTTGKVLANGTAVMAGGAGVLSIISIMKSYEQFANGSQAERGEAAVGMLTGALAFGGAALTLQEQIYRARSNDLRAATAKMWAGRLVASASFIDAALSTVKGFRAGARGDYAAAGVLALQSIALLGAGGAAWAAAMGSSATLFGIGATGWGLILVLIGIGLTFVYYYIKDSPLEEWGALSFWGDRGRAESGYLNLAHEQRQLDMLQSGIKIDFEVKSFTDISTPGGKGFWGNFVLPLALKNFLEDRDRWKRIGIREGKVRVSMPAELREVVRIYIGIYARPRKNRSMALLGAYLPEGTRWTLFENEYPNLSDVRDDVIQIGSEKLEKGVFELVRSCGVPFSQYKDAHAIVWVQEVDRNDDYFDNVADLKISLEDGG